MTVHTTGVSIHPSRDLVLVDGEWVEVEGGNIQNFFRASMPVRRFQGMDPLGSVYGFIGSAHASAFSQIAQYGVTARFTPAPGEVRLQRVDPYSDEVTLVTPSSFEVTRLHVKELVRNIGQVRPREWVSVSGNMPPGLSSRCNLHLQVLRQLEACEAFVLLDTHGKPLRKVLNARRRRMESGRFAAGKLPPHVFKANLTEACDLAGFPIDPHDDATLIALCQAFFPDGLAVISLGKLGLFAHYRGRAWRVQAELPEGVTRISSNGSGDSTTAGLVGGLSIADLPLDGKPWDVDAIVYALSLGAAAGTANLATHIPGEIPAWLLSQLMDDNVQLTPVG